MARTREEQNNELREELASALDYENLSQADWIIKEIEEAEQRGYEWARAECAEDTKRLDWLGGNVTLGARFFLRGGWAAMHNDTVIGYGETLRSAIDAAMKGDENV
ncbi:hypothetical protein [Acetobacter sicerae]|uniref:hypothetical protein n=1 Tax=Acetobacter sicerae TaxID=85325 RepID=UPI00156AA132|nr:hypothetical protein [Acetobacter sicerae]NHN93881.1 hypothetical protein [Acetobacter sicerae]